MMIGPAHMPQLKRLERLPDLWNGEWLFDYEAERMDDAEADAMFKAAARVFSLWTRLSNITLANAMRPLQAGRFDEVQECRATAVSFSRVADAAFVTLTVLAARRRHSPRPVEALPPKQTHTSHQPEGALTP